MTSTQFSFFGYHLKLLDMKIFVDTDSDIRLVRRLRRDITERGRDIEGVIKQYNKFVKPAFEQYIEPTMRLADIVVPRGEWGFNNVHCVQMFMAVIGRLLLFIVLLFVIKLYMFVFGYIVTITLYHAL